MMKTKWSALRTLQNYHIGDANKMVRTADPTKLDQSPIEARIPDIEVVR
jgi:hypothetical protein